MNIELKKLSINDGVDIYEMLQEIPKDENGFINGCNGRSFDEYKLWLINGDNISKGIGLENWMVPQSTYWLIVDGIPVGFGKLRHHLTDKLRQEGGHVGYTIRPSYRNKGYGKLLLKLLIDKANSMGIDRILVTVQNHNEYSIKVALSNGGIVEDITNQRHIIWIDCNSTKSSIV